MSTTIENMDKYEQLMNRCKELNVGFSTMNKLMDIVAEAHRLGRQEAYCEAKEYIADAMGYLDIGLKHS